MLPNRDLFGLISTESLGRAQEGRLGWPAEGCERLREGRLSHTQEVEMLFGLSCYSFQAMPVITVEVRIEKTLSINLTLHQDLTF